MGPTLFTEKHLCIPKKKIHLHVFLQRTMIHPLLLGTKSWWS